MRNIKDLITIDPETLGGQPVFKSSRVPVESLFWHLERGVTLDQFLADFPAVTKEQAVAVIEIAGTIVTYKDIEKLYATAA